VSIVTLLPTSFGVIEKEPMGMRIDDQTRLRDKKRLLYLSLMFQDGMAHEKSEALKYLQQALCLLLDIER
jgi:hypothetical protein